MFKHNLARFSIFALLILPSLLVALNWTVMVYMCADNSLQDQSYFDLQEMMQANSSDQVKIIVQVDNLASSLNPNCQRYLISYQNQELIADLGEVDMANPQTLIDFVRFSKNRFPAQNYLLILWDHGNGWPIGTYQTYRDKAIIYDQSSQNWLGVADGELKYAVSEIKKILGKKIAVLLFDACLMAMAEVADELTDGVEFMLGAQDQNPIDGLCYDQVLSYLVNHPNVQPRTLSEQIINLWTASYNHGSQGFQPVAFSALDLNQFQKARENFNSVLNILSQNIALLQAARLQVQTFSIEHLPPNQEDDYIDLLHFLSLINQQLSNPTLTKNIKQFSDAVIACQSVGEYLAHALGISIWFADNYLSFKYNINEYRNLTWAKNTNWLRLLNNYFNLDDVKPTPTILSISSVGKHNDFYLTYPNSFDLADVNYNIYETQAITQIFLDSCHNFNNWQSNGFVLDTSNYLSPPYSFYSNQGNNLTHTLCLLNPVTIPAGGLLSFYTYYETEETYTPSATIKRDVCYLERSSNNIDWYVIDSFYGQSKTWQEHRYLLAPHDNLYLRFRYQTDATISRLGLYLDDISILVFSNTRLLASHYPDTSFYIYNLAYGTYYYFIIPQDAFGNIGFCSPMQSLMVNNYCEPYTLPSPFYTDCYIYCDYPDPNPLNLSIYTLTGELIRRFDASSFTNKKVYWDGCNLKGQPVASGVYLVVLKTPSLTRIGKIAKVR